MPGTTFGGRDAESIIKFVLFGGTVEAFSISSVVVSTSGANVVTVIVDQELSCFALFFEDTFSGIHQEIVSYTLSAKSSIHVKELTEFTHLMAKVIVTQVLSGWALGWLFDLKADSVWLKSVGWNTSQTCSSYIKILAKITHS